MAYDPTKPANESFLPLRQRELGETFAIWEIAKGIRPSAGGPKDRVSGSERVTRWGEVARHFKLNTPLPPRSW